MDEPIGCRGGACDMASGWSYCWNSWCCCYTLIRAFKLAGCCYSCSDAVVPPPTTLKGSLPYWTIELFATESMSTAEADEGAPFLVAAP